MGSWCADNLRDSQAWKDENLPMTGSSNEAVKLFDAILRQIVSWIHCDQLGGVENCVSNMFQAEPDFFMGKVLMLGLDALGTKRSVHVDCNFATELEDICRVQKCTQRERQHALAVNYFANGEMQSACAEWEKILANHPNDLLALKFSHDAYFFLGDKYGKRDSVARVIRKWSPNAPCYSYLHGMYAFGLEECGEYKAAEEQARIALALNKQDCWATHAFAHCFEMRSDFTTGIKFMESTVQDWSPCSMLACHNFWHNAVFYLEKGDHESALSIFDNEVKKRSLNHGMMLDIVDAASLLTRIELENINVGNERWHALFPAICSHLDDHVLAFNDAHISMILSHTENHDSSNNDAKHESLSAQHLKSLKRFVGNRKGGDNWRVTRDIGSALCDAIVSFNAGMYESVFEKLYAIRHLIFQVGGSHAQRDVFTQIMIHSAVRSPNLTHRQLAIEVIEERSLLKTNSAWAQRFVLKHKVLELL